MNIKDKIISKALSNSLAVTHFKASSCGGCDVEMKAVFIPRYELKRLGVVLTDSPRHADVLACTGPVNQQEEERLKKFFRQIPHPKGIIVIGSCGASGGIYKECYSTSGGIGNILPLSEYPNVVVPGCPPKPEAIVNGFRKMINILRTE